MGYLKPLRRKIGVVTLVIACVFMSWWLRSYGKFVGAIYLPYGGSIRSLNGIVSYREFREILPGSGNGAEEIDLWYLHYSIVVIPLTLLSAWLLLTKPRGAKRSPSLPDGRL